MSNKKLLFSVTASDCEWSYTRGSGNGGQKKNKTSSAVHCAHKPSGAKGYSEASRSQRENKEDAFKKMCNTPEFQKWLKMEISRKTGIEEQIEREVERQMNFVRVEHKEDGKWTEVGLNEDLTKYDNQLIIGE